MSGGPPFDLGEFLLRACHDLRSPLRGIRTSAELLSRDAVVGQASDARQRLSFIVDGAGRMERLLDGLANYSIALHTDPSSFQTVPLGAIIRSVLAKHAKEISANQAEVSLGEMPRVSGSPDRLMQLFENLVLNGIRHRGEAAPRIGITAVSADGGWQFSVQDNGPGIDPGQVEKIFQPFGRLHRLDQGGPGLGLAACREIVERHGGKIWVDSAPGKGSAFVFIIPAG